MLGIWAGTCTAAVCPGCGSQSNALRLLFQVNGVAPGPIAGTAGLTKLAPGAEEKMAKKMAEEIPVVGPKP